MLTISHRLPLLALALAAVALQACGGRNPNYGYGGPYPAGRISRAQLDACQDAVAGTYRAPRRDVRVRAAGYDGDRAVVEWTLRRGPVGTCLVDPNARIRSVQRGSAEAYRRRTDGGRYDGGRYDDRNAYPDASGSASFQQIQFCQLAVARRLGIDGNDVDARSAGRDRDGTARVTWSTRRRDAGSCLVSKQGEVLRIDRR